jgi:hypothetical protein
LQEIYEELEEVEPLQDTEFSLLDLPQDWQQILRDSFEETQKDRKVLYRLIYVDDALSLHPGKALVALELVYRGAREC